MVIVGERINASRKNIRPAIERRDAAFIQAEAKKQAAAGADYVDVNCGVFLDREPEYLAWLVQTVQEVVDTPLCLDSPNPAAIAAGLKHYRNGIPLINSVSNEGTRAQDLIPLIQDYNANVVALCMGLTGAMPKDAADRVTEARALIETLTTAGVPLGNIYVDPVVCPIGNDVRNGLAVLEAIREIMATFPGVHTICGLTNVSHGMPLRKLLNQNFLVLCMAAGLDGVILDPLDQRLMSNVLAAEALLGRDDFCLNYIRAHRAERLVL